MPAEKKKSMQGKTCLVTGASTGIGRATALGLAHLGAGVILVCRDRRRGEAAQAEIRHESANPSVELVLADFAGQRAIRSLAAGIESSARPLDVLIHNAGVFTRRRALTEDGIEQQLAVNHLAPFLLTHLLLPALRRGAPSRVISVSSNAHHGETIDFDDLQSARRYRPTRVYGRTKLANILFTYELARRLESEDERITANCLHPGVIATRLLHDYLGTPGPIRFLARGAFGSPEQGARTSIHLASAADLEGVTGRYFSDCKPAQSSTQSHDREMARLLWRVSEELCGIDPTVKI